MKFKFSIKRINHLDLNMALIGQFDEYECLIYSREGNNIPHFHLEGVQSKRYVSIRIDKPEYFIHGKWKDKLNNSEIKDLIDFLCEKPYGKRSKIYENNFDFIYDAWKWENKLYDLKDIKMSDYRKLC